MATAKVDEFLILNVEFSIRRSPCERNLRLRLRLKNFEFCIGCDVGASLADARAKGLDESRNV